MLNKDYTQYLKELISFDGVRRTTYGKFTYEILLDILCETPFKVIHKMDENRVDDAYDLRNTYYHENNISCEDIKVFNKEPITLLELMISLSQRCDFITNDFSNTNTWFWEIATNAGFAYQHDQRHSDKDTTVNAIKRICEIVIYKQYRNDGVGGFFPISNLQNIAGTELFMQMQYYIQSKTIIGE